MYDRIFFTNVLRVIRERGMSKNELSSLSGVSVSFISDITHGQGNPSLKTLEAIAEALQLPLPLLLEHVDSEVWQDAYSSKSLQKTIPDLPKGYTRVGGIVTEHQAFQVKKWDAEARLRIKKYRNNNV